MELADQQNSENLGVIADAEIPVSPEPPAETASPDKTSEKPLSLREQLNKSVETVRTEEAKRARDVATGKFVPKTETEIKAGAEKPAAEIPKPEQNAQAAAPPADSPPSAWKNIWEKLPEEARALAVKREAEVTKGFDEYRVKTAQLQEISQVFEPIRHVLQQQGVTSDVQAVKALAQWEGAFRNPQTRVQAFHNLAREYGVDLSTLAQPSSQAPSTVQDIPEPLRPVIDQFGNIVQDVRNVQQEIQTLRSERVSQELSTFASKPEHAHFEKVRTIMGQLMTAGLVPPGDLEGAYQKATVLHPEVSAQIKLEAETAAKAEHDRTQAEKAARARQAAVSPSGRSPNGASVNGADKSGKSSVRDSILASVKGLRDEQRA